MCLLRSNLLKPELPCNSESACKSAVVFLGGLEEIYCSHLSLKWIVECNLFV